MLTIVGRFQMSAIDLCQIALTQLSCLPTSREPSYRAFLTIHMCSVQEACSRMGIGQTTMKKLCRAIGVARWPFVKRRTIEATRQLCQKLVLLADSVQAPTPFTTAMQQESKAILGLLDDYTADPLKVSTVLIVYGVAGRADCIIAPHCMTEVAPGNGPSNGA